MGSQFESFSIILNVCLKVGTNKYKQPYLWHVTHKKSCISALSDPYLSTPPGSLLPLPQQPELFNFHCVVICLTNFKFKLSSKIPQLNYPIKEGLSSYSL